MTCTTCTKKLSQDAGFCGACGARTSKRRDALTGILFDGRYRIEAKLAEGGFGSIYRAVYAPTGARVALKVLHPDFARDPLLNARFRREAEVMSSLRDLHTVKTFEHGEAADGTLYIAMELLTGRSLQAELRSQGPLPWWRMLSIMRGVCSSLIEAHALGIVHRDLKPANIHLEDRGGKPDFVKVLDFGIVKVLGNQAAGDDDDDDEASNITRVGQAIGTLEYMSPEQIVGGEIDHRTDIYTLGVVAYEMITGRRPFADATGPTCLMTALMTREVVPPSSLFNPGCLPATVDKLILRCLASDPADRFADASELSDALDEILLEAVAPAGASMSMGMTLPGSGPTRAPAKRPLPLPAARPSQAAQPSVIVRPSMVARSSAARPSAARSSVARPSAARPSVARPSMAARSSLAPQASAAMLDDFDIGDVTTVDVVPLFEREREWEPGLDRSSDRLARTPHLDTPPPPPTFRAARGSTVTVSPIKILPLPSATPPRRRSVSLKLAAWAMALLASGVGLGAIVASLG